MIGDAMSDIMDEIRTMEASLDTVYTVDRQESSQSQPLGSTPTRRRRPAAELKPSTGKGPGIAIPWKLIAGGLAIGAAAFYFTKTAKKVGRHRRAGRAYEKRLRRVSAETAGEPGQGRVYSRKNPRRKRRR